MAFKDIFLIVTDLASVFLFSGIIFGWAPLNDMLIKEGFYHDFCPEGTTEPCDAQRAFLNRAFTLASTAVSVAALPGGLFVDKCGPIVAVTVAGLLNIVGLTGIALCHVYGTSHFDVFLISFVILAIGGSLTMFCGYSLPFLYPRRCTLLIECTSCLFDASCIIFPFMKVFYDWGVKFWDLFWVYLGLCVVNFILLIVAWIMNKEELHRSRSGGHSTEEGSHAPPPPGLQGKPLMAQFRSFEFVVILVFSAIHVMRSNLYLGVVDLVDSQIADKTGNTDSMSWMTTVVGLIIPQGWLAVPLIEMSIHRLGVHSTMQVTSVIAVLYQGIQLIPNLYIQLLGAVVFAMFRAFLFSIITAYNAEVFGPATLGRIMGTCFLVAAIVNMLQNPLVQLSLNQLDGNFVPVNLGALLVCLPIMVLIGVGKARYHATVGPERTMSRAMSRTLSHSTAACTAAHINIASEIEKSFLANEANTVTAEMRQ